MVGVTVADKMWMTVMLFIFTSQCSSSQGKNVLPRSFKVTYPTFLLNSHDPRSSQYLSVAIMSVILIDFFLSHGIAVNEKYHLSTSGDVSQKNGQVGTGTIAYWLKPSP